jgi:hypothetical protein
MEIQELADMRKRATIIRRDALSGIQSPLGLPATISSWADFLTARKIPGYQPSLTAPSFMDKDRSASPAATSGGAVGGHKRGRADAETAPSLPVSAAMDLLVSSAAPLESCRAGYLRYSRRPKWKLSCAPRSTRQSYWCPG